MMTPARALRNIPEPSKAWENTTLTTLLLTHLSANFPHTPGSVPPQGMRGFGVLPSRSPFSSTCSPCPSNSCPLRILPFIQSFPPLRVTVASNLQPSTVAPFPRRPLSLTLPLGVPCPWGLPCHLSELSLFCTPQKIENPRRQGLFGLLCTN